MVKTSSNASTLSLQAFDFCYMSKTKPYQSLLLRLLHGVNALIASLAIISSFLVYNTFDGRFGKLPIPPIPKIIDIHGTFGKILLLAIAPLFALYCFHIGYNRLIQPDSFQKLAQLPKPIGWYSLHRIVNTAMLLAVTFALVSGSMMQEKWLPNGELDSLWYSLHLLGWLGLVCCLALHLLMSVKIGGFTLILSMFTWEYRPGDSPANWLNRIRAFFRGK